MWKYSDLLRNIYKKTGTHDPFKIAMYFDIPTYYVQIDSPLAKTIYLYGQPIILLSDKLQESSAKYYVCGHELGHIFKHTGLVCAYDSNTHFRSNMEREADQFSFDLCNALYHEENGYYPNEINQLNYSYGVPKNFHLSETLR